MSNCLKGIYLVLLGRAIALCGLVLSNAVLLILQLTFEESDIWVRLLSYAVTFVATVVVFCGLLKLYKQNTYFKIAFVLQPISIILIVIFALASELYQIFIPTGDIRNFLSGIPGYVALFCWFWGMASVVKQTGLLRLSKRFKVFPFAMIIFPFLFTFLWLIAFVILIDLLSVPVNSALIFYFTILAAVVQGYELYLLHFTRTQLSSENPKDIGGLFGVVGK